MARQRLDPGVGVAGGGVAEDRVVRARARRADPVRRPTAEPAVRPASALGEQAANDRAVPVASVAAVGDLAASVVVRAVSGAAAPGAKGVVVRPVSGVAAPGAKGAVVPAVSGVAAPGAKGAVVPAVSGVAAPGAKDAVVPAVNGAVDRVGPGTVRRAGRVEAVAGDRVVPVVSGGVGGAAPVANGAADPAGSGAGGRTVPSRPRRSGLRTPSSSRSGAKASSCTATPASWW
jgi:hypothetical protein